MMMLLGDSDQLAGNVKVLDATTNTELAEFYVDTVNSSGGLLGIAVRGRQRAREADLRVRRPYCQAAESRKRVMRFRTFRRRAGLLLGSATVSACTLYRETAAGGSGRRGRCRPRGRGCGGCRPAPAAAAGRSWRGRLSADERGDPRSRGAADRHFMQRQYVQTASCRRPLSLIWRRSTATACWERKRTGRAGPSRSRERVRFVRCFQVGAFFKSQCRLDIEVDGTVQTAAGARDISVDRDMMSDAGGSCGTISKSLSVANQHVAAAFADEVAAATAE